MTICDHFFYFTGFLGMNVQVPFQDEKSTVPFWSIVIASISIAVALYFLRKFVANYKGSYIPKCLRRR